MSTLTGISPEYLFYHKQKPTALHTQHQPYFLVHAPTNKNLSTDRKELQKKIDNAQEESPLKNITRLGEIETYKSFSDHTKTQQTFKVYTKKPYLVPETSNYLFFTQGFYTAEHDIPYQQRVLTDLEAEDTAWIYDTKNRPETLQILVYDIETTQYADGKTNIPIDIIGYSQFPLTFTSSKDLDTEEFQFDITDTISSWEEPEVHQLISRNIDEEIDNLSTFLIQLRDIDIVSGHNIIGFDNIQIHERVNHFLKTESENLTKKQQTLFKEFISIYSRKDKSFHFGVQNQTIQFYPGNLDTFHASKRFYKFLTSHSLKAIAPFLGVHIPNRLILPYDQLALDEPTFLYNRHDVQEQIGVTLDLIQQALPLSFITGMPFDTLMPSGAVSMWDHMSLIRGARQKKIMPPLCRPLSIAPTLIDHYNDCTTGEEIARKARKDMSSLSKELTRIVKYGDEMPAWVTNPYVIYNKNSTSRDEKLNYHLPGGMTIKPDKEAHSDFIPWWRVLVADVGAMYPTILKAMNIGADTVNLAKKNEEPDAWIWLKKLPERLFEDKQLNWRKIDPGKDTYADRGYMLGIKIDTEPGVVNCAMTGIMSMIAKTKRQLKEAETKNDKEELKRLKIMYQSVKGARNAGSVDHDQPILLVNPDGDYSNPPIGDFVDSALKEHRARTETINGTTFELVDLPPGWTAVSVDRNGKRQLKTVRQAVRHRYTGKLLKITTRNGSTIVTPNHSIFTIKDQEIQEISAEDLTEDCSIVHVRRIPDIKKEQTQNGNIHFADHPETNSITLNDCYTLAIERLEQVDPTSDYVYDISVEENENFLDAHSGILLHNTHGILVAPGVSGRQFNLWGGAAITTKGQIILDDTLKYLEDQGIRVVYGDTDGIYLGCSRSAANTPDIARALNLNLPDTPDTWLTKPDKAIRAVDACNTRWRKELSYPDFELEPELHDAMIFIKHKNYLIFDTKNGELQLTTKGNNFKGSDKANIARKVLKDIMTLVLKEHHTWTDEEDIRNTIRQSIIDKTQEVISTLDLSDVDINDLILIQSVQPSKHYKPNQNGSLSTFGRRSQALERVLGRQIRTREKIRFVVTKKPLPGIVKPSKSGVKPIDYMYPLDLLQENNREIDMEWYKNMIENYIKGAFGLTGVTATKQTGLDAWM